MHIDRPHPSPLPGEKVIVPITCFCIKSFCWYCAHRDIIRSDVKKFGTKESMQVMVPARPSVSVPVWWQGGLTLGGTVRPTNPGHTKVLIFTLRVRRIQLNCISVPVVPWNGVMKWEGQSHSPIRAPFYFSLFHYWRVTFCHHTCSWEMYSITLWKHMLGVSLWFNKRLRPIDCHFVVPNTIEISHFPSVLVMGSI